MKKTLIALSAALVPMSHAQDIQFSAAQPSTLPATTAPSNTLTAANALSDIEVTGVDTLLGNYLKASLSTQPGADISSLNLKQVETEALATGYFKSATAALVPQAGSGPVLRVAVVPNPTLSAVDVTGLSFFPADGFKQRVADMLNIAPGVTLNTARVEQSKQLLLDNFRTQGYPFTPTVTTATKLNKDGTATLTYTINESAPIKRIEIVGNTRLPKDLISAAFKPLYSAKKFTPDVYFQAVQSIGQAYQQRGYLASGVDPQGTTLENGVLHVKIAESTVSTVTFDGIDTPAAALQTRVGQPVVQSVLEADLKTLSNASEKSVGFALQPDAQNPGQVAVTFGDSQITTGPIKEVHIAGNTIVSTADLQKALSMKVGDVYSQQLAESNFYALREVYRAKGYDISTRDAFSYSNGVVTFNIREATINKFELNWQGKHRTKDRVILRELQNIHGAATDAEVRAGIDRIMRLGIVKITNVTTRADDPKNPEALTYILTLSDQSGTRSIPLGVQYDTLNGWQGSLGVTNSNLFGLGHQINATVSAQPTGSGQLWGGSVTYTIPWLDIDFADFRKTRTSLSFTVGSTLSPNNTLYTDDTDTYLTGRQYTTRSTGFGMSLGRSLGRYATGTFGIRSYYSKYYLEAIASGEGSSYSDSEALAVMPKDGLTTSFGPGLNYDSTDSGDYPTRGVRANLSATYSFGHAGDKSLHWSTIEAGASTYKGFGKMLFAGTINEHKQQVFAVRLNAGTIFGTAPSSALFSIGGSTVPASYELRGVDSGTLKGTSYLTSSAEYRYDFGISNSVLQGIYGIGFIDAGMARSSDGVTKSDYSAGAGLQLNLGLNGSPLASLRFDYGFSPSNDSRKFSFRLGPVW